MRLFIACLIIYGLHMSPWLYLAACSIVAGQWLRPMIGRMRSELAALRKKIADEERERQHEREQRISDALHS